MRNQLRNSEKARKMRKAEKWLKTLSPEQIEYMNMYSNDRTENDIRFFIYVNDLVTENILTDIFGYRKAAGINKIIAKNVNNEGVYIQKLFGKGEEYMAKMENGKENVIKEYEKIIKEEPGKKMSEIVDAVSLKTSLSINQTKKIINEYRKKKVEEEGIKKIDSLIEETDKKEVKKTTDEDKLQILDITLKLKGKYGTYEYSDNKVTVDGEIFNNEKEVSDWEYEEVKKIQSRAEEIKKVFSKGKQY